MTYSPGDPGHIDVHNDLRAQLAGMGATTLPPVRALGDAGHVADHGLFIAALEEVAAAWGVTGTPLPPPPVLGQGDHVADHNTIVAGIAWLEVNGWNAATGGTVTDVPNYNGTGQTWRVHQFTANTTLVVTRGPRPFRVALLAPGGGGGPLSSGRGGGGGGGGELLDRTLDLAPGNYPLVFGSPSTFCGLSARQGNGGGPGDTSSGGARNGGSSGNGNQGGLNRSDSWQGGGGGGNGGGAPQGGPPGPGTATTITGTSITRGNGGWGGDQGNGGAGDGTWAAIAYAIGTTATLLPGSDDAQQLPNDPDDAQQLPTMEGTPE